MTAGLPKVTAVVPCRNERKYIGACLESLLQSDYPMELLDVVVADGMSEDGTREIIADVMRRAPHIRLLDNPGRILASAWNVGIRAACGEIIIALNAHTTFAPDYFRVCIDHLARFPDAGYVGGIVKTLPQEDTTLGRAIAAVLSHRFGVGGSKFRVGVGDAQWSDTAAFGGYRKSLFDEIGLFNEQLVRSQDMELHLRMKAAGKRILLVPQMVGTYYTRSSLSGFLRFCYINGYWATYPLKFSRHMLSPRHLIPMVFVLTLAAGVGLGLGAGFWWPVQTVAGAYAVAAAIATLDIAWRHQSAAMLLLLPGAFASLHVLYGIGSVAGLVTATMSGQFWKHLFD